MRFRARACSRRWTATAASLAALAGGLAAGVVGALVEDSGPVLLVVAVFALAAWPATCTPVPRREAGLRARAARQQSSAEERRRPSSRRCANATIAVLGGSEGTA